MKKKIKQFTYDNGYVITCPNKANDIVNRKIFSKQNEKYEKIYLSKNDFARWIPTLSDVPSIIHSIEFFSNIKQTSETQLNKEVVKDAENKMLYLVMKLGDVPGIIPAKRGDNLGTYLSKSLERLKNLLK